jgi:hypothetical protein
MQIDDTEFHVVQTPDSDHIVESEQEAIALLQNGAVDIDGESDDVSVVRVNYDRDDWVIESLPWQRIALKLLSEQ